jgi:hypothetical protein
VVDQHTESLVVLLQAAVLAVVVMEDKVPHLLLAQLILAVAVVVAHLVLVIYTMVVQAVLEWLFSPYQQLGILVQPQDLQ